MDAKIFVNAEITTRQADGLLVSCLSIFVINNPWKGQQAVRTDQLRSVGLGSFSTTIGCTQSWVLFVRMVPFIAIWPLWT